MDFPSHNIDPRKKDKNWHLQMVKAIWEEQEQQPRKMFYHYAREYDKNKKYAYGRQDTTPYKKAMHVDEQTNQTPAVLDFRQVQPVKKYRRIALSLLNKRAYDIVATPIDPAAKEEADKYFAEVAAKMMLRQAMMQQVEMMKQQGIDASDLAQAPQLKAQPDEPIDEEELKMVQEFGFKHTYAKEAEMGIQLTFLQNNWEEQLERLEENLFDDGVCVVKDWMEPSGKIGLRVCDNRSVISSVCRYADFRDLRYMGEIVEQSFPAWIESVGDQLTEEEIEIVREKSKAGKWERNYVNQRGTEGEKWKVKVLDIEFLSEDDIVYEDNKTRMGNTIFVKADFENYNKRKEKYRRVRRQFVYRAKWVVGTNIVYDFGRAPYQKRPNGINKAELSYHVYAVHFHDMQASGMMEEIIPIADQMAIAWLKLQHIRNELLPFFVEIDLDALEDVDLGKGGQKLKPKDLIQMMFQKGILLTRRKGLTTNNPNYKSIEFVATTYGQAITDAWNDYQQHRELLRDMTGFNEVTDGSTPNERNLNSTNQVAQESTNNSLDHLFRARKTLIEKVAYAVMCRIKRAVKDGKVQGLVPALGTDTAKFIQLSPDVAEHDYGLKLEVKPTQEQKAALQQLMAKGLGDGTLDATDFILIENTQNLKQAEARLAYRINKRKEQQQQQALEMQRANAETQIQSAQAAEKAKQETLAVEYDLKMQLMDKQKGWDYKIKELELGIKHQMNKDNIQSNEKQAGITTTPEPTPVPDNEGMEMMPDSEGMEGEMGMMPAA